MKFLITNLKQKGVEPRDKARIYIAIGKLALSVKEEILKHIPEILPELMQALSQSSQKDKEKDKLKKGTAFFHPSAFPPSFPSFSFFNPMQGKSSRAKIGKIMKDESDKGGSEKERGAMPSVVDEALICIADIFKAVPRQLQMEIDSSRLDIKDLLGMI